MAKILITGITGFIGGSVASALLPLGHEITALVRPGSSQDCVSKYLGGIKLVYVSLSDIPGLKAFLETADFDTVIHIGALRGGRKANREEYYRSNVSSTEQFVTYCVKSGARLIFCSSVGIWGAIPSELP
ncbi:MAG TPA: NAD-dependent epimerase/dehydratase family protein, partial [Candidatus Cloacimonadota bacterium]|nr:NAD-dependent epimerase/dehydratase family protein [Candidatus Cloacimonadota bacterium]